MGVWQLWWQVRNCKKMKNWRQKVFERDRGICQRCGQKVGNLHVHHKKSLGLLLTIYKIETLPQALECRQVWDLKNGTTLCQDCHRKAERELHFTVIRCKDCGSTFGGFASLTLHQKQTGHTHSKKLGLEFNMPSSERQKLKIIRYDGV